MKGTVVAALCVLLTGLVGCVPEKYVFDSEIGKSGSGPGELRSPSDMALNPDGDLVVCDSGNHRIQVLSSVDGSPKLQAGEYGTTHYKVQGLSGLGVNPSNGDIWVCDLRGNKLVKFDKRGNPVLKIVDKDRMKYPIDVAVDRRGDIYVLMSKQPQIYKFDGISGSFLETIGGTGKAALVFGTSILVHDDHLFVTDYGGRRVLKLTLKGEFVAEYDKKGDYEEIRGPSGLFIDSQGNFLLLDLGEVPVVMLDSQGKLLSKIGNFGSDKGQFLYPRGIVAKPSGEILVLDNSRNVILVFKKIAQ
ncbi:MAG: hypothetical protein OZSIB_2008 [Candidatus Ozemobacter sibiricus]|uniref:NHL repeat domain protein n=1 Tax=Candidatus Ozemobacter sibiricus TaxID=2268124 RepID=A0A367ZJE2_9BACT|nr:MAG: hypothetical protein OZSIB_2008 [Candidatus Ozemobacter sibiricus]